MIGIYSNEGVLRLSVSPSDDSRIVCELMKEHYIKLSFNVPECVDFCEGDYITVEGVKYTMYDVKSPTLSGGLRYELQFDAQEMFWQYRPFFFNPGGAEELSWSYTSTIANFAALVIKNLEYIGISCDVVIDADIETTIKAITFNGSIWDAVTSIAEEYETEWWYTEGVLHLGKCASSDRVVLDSSLISDVSESDGENEYITRLYAFGSTNNIPSYYRKTIYGTVKTNGTATVNNVSKPFFTSDITFESGWVSGTLKIEMLDGKYKGGFFEVSYDSNLKFFYTPTLIPADSAFRFTEGLDRSVIPGQYLTRTGSDTVEGIADNCLMLPEGTRYVDAFNGVLDASMNEAQIKPKRMQFDIYPKRVGTMADIVTVQNTDEADGVKTVWNAFQFKDASFNWDKKYQTEEELRIVFQTGKLAGLDFKVEYVSGADGEPCWEIFRNSDYGANLPNDILRPEDGDTYILYGFDIAMVSDVYIPQAESELLEAAKKYVQRYSMRNKVHSVKTNPVECENQSFNCPLGQSVSFSCLYFTGEKNTRIYGFEKSLNNPYVCTYKVGESKTYTRLNAIESSIEDITYKTQTYDKYVVSNHYHDNKSLLDKIDQNLNSSSDVKFQRVYFGGDKCFAQGGTDLSLYAALKEFIRLEADGTIRLRFNTVCEDLMKTLNLTVDETASLMNCILSGYISSSEFIPGFTGKGMKIYKEDGEWKAEFDRITVRKTLTVFEYIVSKLTALNGDQLLTQGHGKIKEVTLDNGYYKIILEDELTFTSNDWVHCQTRNKEWSALAVISGGALWLPSSYFTDSVPEAGDSIVQVGNSTDTTRQSAIYLQVNSGKPYIDILSGIRTKSFADCMCTRFGCLDGITDSSFPSDAQPSGYGIYSSNAFLKGTFVLSNGQTLVEFINGKVLSEVSSIQIGGVNLLTQSGNYYATEDISEWGNVNNAPTKWIAGGNLMVTMATSGISAVQHAVSLVAGKTYTFQLWYQLDEEAAEMVVKITNADYSYYAAQPALTPGGSYVKMTFTPSKACTRLIIGRYAATPTENDTLAIEKIKIEEGTVATAWTVAQEETIRKITAVTQTADEVSVKAQANEDAIAEINVQADKISLTVSNAPNTNYALGTATSKTLVNSVSNTYTLTGSSFAPDGIVVSFDIVCNTITASISPLLYVMMFGASYPKSILPVTAGESVHATYLFAPGNSYTALSNLKVYVRATGATGTWTVSNLKVERGEIETAWSANPADMGNALSETGIDITTQKITLKGDTEIYDSDGNKVALFADGRIKTAYLNLGRLDLIDGQIPTLSELLSETGGTENIAFAGTTDSDANLLYITSGTYDRTITTTVTGATIGMRCRLSTKITASNMTFVSHWLTVNGVEPCYLGTSNGYYNWEFEASATTLEIEYIVNEKFVASTDGTKQGYMNVRIMPFMGGNAIIQYPEQQRTVIGENGQASIWNNNYFSHLSVTEGHTLMTGAYGLKVCEQGVKVTSDGGNTWNKMW